MLAIARGRVEQPDKAKARPRVLRPGLDRVEHAGQAGEQPAEHPAGDGSQQQVGPGNHRHDEPVQDLGRELDREQAGDRQRQLVEIEPVLAAGPCGRGEDDDVEDLGEDQRRDCEVDVAQPEATAPALA